MIQDTKIHPITCNMTATKMANIGSYLGVPIFDKNGQFYGTLCAVDSKPYNFTPEHIRTLERLSLFFSYALDLEKQANQDALTGLYNRNFLYKLFDNYATTDSSHQGTLMFLDLDGFKTVNDRYGHETGDVVLKEVARRLKSCLQEPDDLGIRLGGDEFILIFPNLLNQKEIERKASEILFIMSEWGLYEQPLQLSTSIGIISYSKKNKEIRTLLKCADTALYKAKVKGKNNYQFF